MAQHIDHAASTGDERPSKWTTQAQIAKAAWFRASKRQAKETTEFSDARNRLIWLVPSGNTTYAGGEVPKDRQREPEKPGSHLIWKPIRGRLFVS
jgi:hypothetical protein